VNKTLSTEKAFFELGTEDRMDAIASTSDDETDLVFTDIKLQANGDKIETITYKINHGKFIEHLNLTNTEVNNKTQLVEDNIHIIYQSNNSETWQGIKEIGNTYTVNANDQAASQYSLAVPPKTKNDEGIIINATIKYQ